MSFPKCVAHAPRRTPIGFGVKRSRSNIEIELHLTFSNDTSYMGCPWPEEDPCWFLSPKVKTKFWELEFVAVEVSFDFLSPAFHESKGIKTHLSIYLSVHHKNLNLAHIFWSMNDRAMIFGMHDPCDKPFQLAPCRDLDLQGQSCFRAGTTILRIFQVHPGLSLV